MDRQYIRDNQVIERYLSGALTADEEQAFEEAYLGDAELLDQLQAAERLREGIERLDQSGDLERSRPRWQQTLAAPRYAAAASVLLAVSLVFSAALYRENRSLRDNSFLATSPITQLVALDTVRGGNAVEIREPQQDELTVLLLDAGTVAYDTYRAVLTRRDGAQPDEVYRRADLSPQLGGSILIGLAGRVLRPGTYDVRLEGRMDDWPVERFEEVTRTTLAVVPLAIGAPD